MRRRDVLLLIGGAAAWPLTAYAQEAGKVARVGVLFQGIDSPLSGAGYRVLIAELRKLGFTEGRNLVVDHRSVNEGTARAFAGANELVADKADVLIANGPEIALQAAAAARPPVPIVMLANNYDPFARGYVKSLSHPGGNITGLFFRQPELAAKQLELLAEAFPNLKRVGVLWEEASADQFSAAERAAKAMRLMLVPVKLETPPYDFDAAVRALSAHGAEMLLALSGPQFTAHRRRIAELATGARMPSMFIFKLYAEAGGLMAYGVDTDPMWRRAASYVAKILRGAQPSDLPVEQASNFELVVNLKTAKALGVTIPTSILLRADEVIE